MLRSLKPDLTINLAKEREFQDHLTNPGLIEDLVELKMPRIVLLDEIQRIPGLLHTVQALIDEKEIRFLITGSSARKLRRGQANLLPGRIINRSLFPLTVKELDYKVVTNKAVRFGFLPGIVCEENEGIKGDILSSYVSNYLKEEIQQEALTRNLGGYSTLINSLPDWVGRDLDYSKIATKNKLNRFSVHRFFEILEDTLIGNRVAPWTFDEDIKTVKHPKFYFFDNGVMNGIHRKFDPAGFELGITCETIIFNQIRALLTYKNRSFKISFFRTHSGIEADFIIETDKDILAVEVKANDKLASDDVRHLKWLKDKNPQIEVVLFHFGKRTFKIDGVWCFNWLEGLEKYFD